MILFLNEPTERLSALLKKLFENHVTGDANEVLVKAAAHGDSQKSEEVRNLEHFLFCMPVSSACCSQYSGYVATNGIGVRGCLGEALMRLRMKPM